MTWMRLATLTLALTMGCADTQPARLLDRAEDYERLGLTDTVENWEDGMRTDGGRGSFEWWYTDAEFEDGTTVVAVFYTKDQFDVSGPAHPTATIEVTLPDGEEHLVRVQEDRGDLIDASTTEARVSIANTSLRQEGDTYYVTFEGDGVHYEAEMVSTLPMWRPETGFFGFGEEDENYFAWVVAQPAAEITATLTIGDETRELHGHGYHDHNWGNEAMHKLIDHWYWGRTTVGDTSVIFADIISHEDYGYQQLPVSLFAKDGQILPGHTADIEVERAERRVHDGTGKVFDDKLTVRRQIPDGPEFTLELNVEEDLVVDVVIDSLGAFTRTLAKVGGQNPTYLRVAGDVTLTTEEEGQPTTVETASGLWEQMYFGNGKQAVEDLDQD